MCPISGSEVTSNSAVSLAPGHISFLDFSKNPNCINEALKTVMINYEHVLLINTSTFTESRLVNLTNRADISRIVDN